MRTILNIIIPVYLLIELILYEYFIHKIEKPKFNQYQSNLENLRQELRTHPDEGTKLKIAKIIKACETSNRKLKISSAVYFLANLAVLLLIIFRRPGMAIFVITIEILLTLFDWSELNYIVERSKSK